MNARSESRPGNRPAADWAQDTLRRLGARLAPGAGGFVHWWAHNLAAWLPARVRRVLGFDRGRLLLQLQVDGVQLRLQQGGDLRDLGTVPQLGLPDDNAIVAPVDPLATLLPARLTDLPRWLLLPAATGLRRRLSLPAAAGERLRDVVGFEIDRQTPFTVETVAYDARVLARRDGDGLIDAELVVVPRQRLDAPLAALGPLARSLAGVDLCAENGTPLGVNLLDPAQRRRHGDAFRFWNLALAAVAVVAVAATMWQLLENRRAAADELQQRIASQAAAARSAAAQRQALIDLIEGQAFLDRERAQRPTAVEVMDELTRRLPDTTYLEKLAIEDNNLLMIGLSREAPSLIQRLQESKLWRAPSLTGALMPDPASGRDRFTLTAELGPATPAAASRAQSPPPSTEDADGG
ncbi:PilN domain-containing protein [Lysobacter sp. MMG2]|uniref:PilN domain-containing protein n=1 Tax=Lysobacter sp. MMG2 TaxID=2801338 RepID=UPI001C210D1D|nr:PilN domain-containing protein [Lysobacter sp. MMG2]MBU8975597.1 PilN domain-containing protein [Lysobacter sp. MMG2]